MQTHNLAARATGTSPRPTLIALNPAPSSWPAILDEFELYGHARGQSPRTIEGRRQVLSHFAKFSMQQVDQVTIRDLRQYLARPLAPMTRSTMQANLKVFFRWCLREGIIESNPCEWLDPVKLPRRRPRPVTTEILVGMLTGARARTRTMILLAAFQGWRASEIARARTDMFDLEEGVVRWIGKGSVDREGEIHPLVRAEVLKYPKTGYWFPACGTNKLPHIRYKSVSDLMHHALKRAGVEDPRLTGHSLRHYFGSELVKAGVDIRIIQEMMGHANLSTTALYTQVPRSMQQDAMQKLGADLPDFITSPPRRRHRATSQQEQP